MLFIQLYFWIAPHVLLAFCLVKMVRMGVQKQFPVFVIYIFFQELHFVLMLTVNLLILHSQASVLTYRWLLIIGIVISGLLQLASLYEISAGLVMRHSPLARALWPLMRWAAALFVLVAATISGVFSQPGIQRVTDAFEVLNFSAGVINIGMLIVLLAFTRAFHLPWRSLPAGLVLGFGVNSSVEMAATMLMSTIGSRGYIAMDLVRMAGFHVCVLVWMIYVFRLEKSAQVVGRGLSKVDLEFWNEELQRLVE
jgi:hypothetical protein